MTGRPSPPASVGQEGPHGCRHGVGPLQVGSVVGVVDHHQAASGPIVVTRRRPSSVNFVSRPPVTTSTGRSSPPRRSHSGSWVPSGQAQARGEARRRVPPPLVDPGAASGTWPNSGLLTTGRRTWRPSPRAACRRRVEASGQRLVARPPRPALVGVVDAAVPDTRTRRRTRSGRARPGGGRSVRPSSSRGSRPAPGRPEERAPCHRSARTSDEPPCPGRSTRTSSWSTARSSARPPTGGRSG